MTIIIVGIGNGFLGLIMVGWPYIELSGQLDCSGLCWQPEIGDEVSFRDNLSQVSILVDPDGMTPAELRSTFLWLPTIEQLICQIEVRQGIIFHTGLELNSDEVGYKTVLKAPVGHVESHASTLRLSLGFALRDMIVQSFSTSIH